MAKASEASVPLLVAAIDFGTTYSGYAFSMRDDPLKVQINQNWFAGSESLISLKAPTCVLVDRSGYFHSFGYEAENKYTCLAEDGEHHGWRLFRRFKMFLHNNKTLSRSSTIKDMNGDSMQAFPIFTMAIGFLKDHLMETVSKRAIGIEETDIKYVLTVPAIWDDGAKQFMREAAVKAGIDTKRLKLALEPEAASIWCEKINAEANVALAGAGTQYMVVDLGGGTADISVHEKKSDGTLKEIHRASGGPWGGIYVDENYLQTMTNIFGDKAMEELKTENINDYFDMLREFEIKKRTFSSPMKDNRFFIRISNALRELSEKHYGEKLKDRLQTLNYGNLISPIISGDKLRFDQSVVQTWFKGPVDSLIKHVKEVLLEAKMATVQTILLVGGFGESQYVQERFQTELKNLRVIVPEHSGSVVLQGAVRFGHEPNIVASRVMKYSYGLQVTADFTDKYPVSLKQLVKGREVVNHVFSPFIIVNDEMNVKDTYTHSFVPGSSDSTGSAVRIFRSSKRDTMFTTDPSCVKLGEFEVRHPDGNTLEEKALSITFIFGGTELVVKARIKSTGKEEHITIDCL